jgi:hypothetical protein
MGGREMFPYLVDPNTGTAMYESDDIVRYLYRNYGAGRAPLAMTLPIVTEMTASFATMLYSRGFSASPSTLPEQPLELIGTEASPQTRIVRSRLCTLELPYVMRCAEADSTRPIPQLRDPNAADVDFVAVGVEPALRHLNAEYAAA